MSVKMRFLTFVTVVLPLVAGVTPAYAYLFPDNALNVRTDITGNGSWTAFTPASGSIYTVLYESYNTDSIQQNGQLHIKCGNTETLTVHSFKNVPNIERFKMAKCNNSLIANTTGANSADLTTMSLIYVPYDIASSSLYASGSFSVSGSLSSGDILIVLSLFILIMLELFAVLRRHA